MNTVMELNNKNIKRLIQSLVKKRQHLIANWKTSLKNGMLITFLEQRLLGLLVLHL